MRVPCTALAILLALSAPLAAQTRDGWAAARVGFLWQGSDDRGANQPLVFGATAGKWLADYWGVDLTAHVARPDFSRVHASGTESLVAASLLMNMNPGGRTWNPYLKLGVGADTYKYVDSGEDRLKSRSKVGALAGVGVQYRPQDRWFFALEFLGVQHEWNMHEWPLTLSVGATF